MVRKREDPLFFFHLLQRMLQSLKINPVFRLGDPGGDQLADCLVVRAYLSEYLSPEAPFRPSCSDLWLTGTLAMVPQSLMCLPGYECILYTAGKHCTFLAEERHGRN